MYEYKIYLSENEVLLASYFDMVKPYLIWDDTELKYYLNSTISIPVFYQIMVERAFLANKETLWNDVLRTIVSGMNNCTLYRDTPEFDAVFDKINWIRTGDSKYDKT